MSHIRMMAVVLGAAFGALAFATSPALGAPGSPGVPGPPAVVFAEDFENVTDPAFGQTLTSYTGAPPTSMTYTAHPSWLNAARCNGIIGAYNSTTGSSGCAAGTYNGYIRPLARAMGALLGGGDDNQVMGDVTAAGSAAVTPAATLQTVSPVPVPAGGRFITFSVDAGATACHAAHPRLRFYLMDGATPVAVSNSAIDACTDPRGTVLSGVRVGRYATDNAMLLTGGSIGVRLTNDQGGSNGNDYAVDNIRMLDATPQLDKSFADDVVGVGETTTLTLTVTNTNDLAAKPGWSFTDTLPSGMRVASPANAGTTCDNGTVTAPAGAGSVQAGGDLGHNDTHCTITVDVTSDLAGTYSNGPANITSSVGLDAPGTDSVQFTQADLSLTKTADRAKASPGDVITYSFTVTNNGPGGAHDVTVRDPLSPHLIWVGPSPAGNGCDFGGGEVVCDFGSVPAGATVTKSFRAQLHPDHHSGEAPTAHLIDVVKVERFWSLQAGSGPQQTAVECPAGYVATDGSARIDSVDQNTSGQSRVDLVRVLASGSDPADARRWSVRAENTNATGQAQLHVFAVCVGVTTTETDGHTHDLQTGALQTSGPHAVAGGERTSVTVSCPAGSVVVAPGYEFGGTIFRSEPLDGGNSWILGLEMPPGPPGSAEISWRCLERQTTTAGSPAHAFALSLYDVHRNVSVPPSNLGSSQPYTDERVTCPDGSKGIVGSWHLPAGVQMIGNTPQPINRDFRLHNSTAQAQNAELDLLCLKSRIGDALNGGSVQNEAYVYSDQPDWNWSDNLASVVVEDPPRTEASAGDDGSGGDDTPAPAPAPAAPPPAPAPAAASGDSAPAATPPSTTATTTASSVRRSSAARRRCVRQARRAKSAKLRRRAVARCHMRYRRAR